jgi:hypothetical protein
VSLTVNNVTENLLPSVEWFRHCPNCKMESIPFIEPLHGAPQCMKMFTGTAVENLHSGSQCRNYLQPIVIAVDCHKMEPHSTVSCRFLEAMLWKVVGVSLRVTAWEIRGGLSHLLALSKISLLILIDCSRAVGEVASS